MTTLALPARSQREWRSDLPERLSEAADGYSLPDRPEWSDLDELSSRTIFEGIDVFGDESAKEGDHFVAPANVYVRLTYGPENDGSEMMEVYPSRVHFRIIGEKEEIRIDRIDVDTSSFFD